MRTIVALLLVASLLAGCAMPVAAPPAPPAPTADPLDEFRANFVAFQAGLEAMSVQFESRDFASADWRTETAAIATDWRTSIAALREMAQPAGARWDRAWPVLMDAMTELDSVASVTLTAIEQENALLMLPVYERVAAGVDLLTEVGRILEGE